ncbi:MAG: NADH-quinone oxidoreductase subunit NuoI [Thermodesulfobacteriota bacterium]
MYKESWLQRVRKQNKWMGIVLFLDLLDGLALTFSYLFAKSITVQYPDKEKWIPYERFRGHHFLRRDEKGENKCVACELCAKMCPSNCIKVVPAEDEKGKRFPIVYDIDMSRCLFCGLCEDACPVEAIALGHVYEFATYESKDLYKNREDFLNPDIAGKIKGGKVVKAKLVADKKGVAATPVDNKGYHWWNNVRRR